MLTVGTAAAIKPWGHVATAVGKSPSCAGGAAELREEGAVGEPFGPNLSSESGVKKPCSR